jgi:pilus assembly protein CpaE
MSAHPSPTVRVACSDPILLDEVIRHLEEIPHWRLLASAHSVRELLSGPTSQADFLILSDSVAEELAGNASAPCFSGEVIVFGRQERSQSLKAALKLGARDFVLWPDDRLRLRETIEDQRAVATSEHRLSSGRLHAVWSPKGGSGTSVVAAHLAAAMATIVPNTTCILMDLDVGHADQTAILQAEDEEKSILDLLRVADELSVSMVESVARRHPEGFRAILSPEPRAQSATVEAVDVAKVLATAREAADHVIVDLPSGLSEVTTRILQDSSTVLLVVTPDLLSLRRARHAFTLLRVSGVDPTSFVGVLNQAGGTDVSEKDLRSVLGLTTTFRVKADLQVYRAANRGELSLAGKRMLVPVARMLRETVRVNEAPAIPTRMASVEPDGKYPASQAPRKGHGLRSSGPRESSTTTPARNPTVVRVVGSSQWRG